MKKVNFILGCVREVTASRDKEILILIQTQGSAHLACWPLLVTHSWGGWIQTAWGAERTENIQCMGNLGQGVHISLLPLFPCHPSYFSNSWVLALLSWQSQLSAVLLRALQIHRSLPCSQSIFSWLLLGNSVIGDRKGGGPVDPYAHTSQSLKIQAHWDCRAQGKREPCFCAQHFGLGSALVADQQLSLGLRWELKLWRHRTMVHGFLGESSQLPEIEAGGLGVQPREGRDNALAREGQLSHLGWMEH